MAELRPAFHLNMNIYYLREISSQSNMAGPSGSAGLCACMRGTRIDSSVKVRYRPNPCGVNAAVYNGLAEVLCHCRYEGFYAASQWMDKA